MWLGVAVSHKVKEPNEDGTEMPYALQRAGYAEGLEFCYRARLLTLQQFVLRLLYMNCSMSWVFLDSSS